VNPGGRLGMSAETVGFVGLGNMGSALAANLVAEGFAVAGHDAVGPDRAPAGVTPYASVADVAREAEVVVLSLPDGDASEEVAQAIASTRERRTTHVVDTSTVGVRAAERVSEILAGGGIGHVDAPVSGGVAGARARTLMVMYAGAEPACARVEPVLAGLSDRRRRVGDRPGMAQAMKLANNFLSATALAATSEAVAFGTSVGLDLATMIEVLNESSGRSAATSDKFVNHVLTGTYSAGFTAGLMAKDVDLYIAAVHEHGRPAAIAAVTAAIWDRFAADEPTADFTRIHPFVGGR
jgi:3-hydroxyisobutyrate dehydrogenase